MPLGSGLPKGSIWPLAHRRPSYPSETGGTPAEHDMEDVPGPEREHGHPSAPLDSGIGVVGRPHRVLSHAVGIEVTELRDREAMELPRTEPGVRAKA